MHTRISIALILVTLFSLGLAIHAQWQLRVARAIVAADVSGTDDADVMLEPPVAPARFPVVAPVVSSASDVARLQALQQQVTALQAECDKLRAGLAASESSLAVRSNEASQAATPAVIGTNVPRYASFDARMAALKQEDPARYEEIQKQREEFRQRVQSQAEARADFLNKVDTASMTDEQRINHEKLVQSIEQARVMMAEITAMSPEDAAAARQKMFETFGSVADLFQRERRYLLEQTGRAMGYPGAEAGQFADYMQQIFDQTAMPRGFGGRGGRGGGTAASGTPGVGASPPAK